MTPAIRQKIREIVKKYDVNAMYAERVFLVVQNLDDPLVEAGKIISEKPKPFVKWVGGKRQLLKQFRTLLTLNNYLDDCHSRGGGNPGQKEHMSIILDPRFREGDRGETREE